VTNFSGKRPFFHQRLSAPGLTAHVFKADDSKVIWTSRSTNGIVQLLSLPADVELIGQKQQEGRYKTSVVLTSQRNDSEFWAIASDYRTKRVFFSDYK